MPRRLIAIAGIAVLAGGLLACSTARLSERGSNVVADRAADVSHCEHLGSVAGNGGGSFGGAWISNSNLVEYAMNDLRNEASERGATHVVPGNVEMPTNQSGSATTAVILGEAYRCDRTSVPPAASAPVAASPAPMPVPVASVAPPGPAAGVELGPCYGNGTCNDGLVCGSGVCVRIPAQ